MSVSTGWQRLFAERCQGMKQAGETTSRSPFHDGIITWQEGRKCVKCGMTGVWCGIGLVSDHLFTSTNADYCGTCDTITSFGETLPLAALDGPEAVLLALTYRFRNHPRLRSTLRQFGKCKQSGCDKPAMTVTIPAGKLGAKSYMFFFCSDPSCCWEGTFVDSALPSAP